MRTVAAIAAIVALVLFPSVCLGQKSGQKDEVNAKEGSKIFGLGEPFDATGFQLTLLDARLGRNPKWLPAGGLVFESELNEPFLILTFRITNTDDRKLLRYSRWVLSTTVQLHDDANNSIRSSSRWQYSDGRVLVGGLEGNKEVEILPGGEAMHVEVFEVPPPKTKYLILAMDLAPLGREGTVQFKIPAKEIKPFGSKARANKPAPGAAAKRKRRETAQAEKERQSKDSVEADKLRTWIDSTGEHKIEARFSGLTSGKVKLIKQDGSTVEVPLEKLSDDDQQWIKDRKE